MRYGKKSTSPFFLLSLLLLFFSLNPCISKTLRGTGLNFCTQVGFNDSMCSESLRVLHKMDDSQLETTPLRSFFGLPKFSYLMHTCPPTHISQATRDFDVAMKESLESILGAPLCEWSWLKALLPSSGEETPAFGSIACILTIFLFLYFLLVFPFSHMHTYLCLCFLHE